MEITVRPFRPDEASVLGAIRLEALADTPGAFAEQHDVAVAMGGEDFTAHLAASAAWGVFLDRRCVGMAILARHVGTNVAHRATVGCVYIAPGARGSGAARTLFQTLIGQARVAGIEILQLAVGDFNARARQLYQNMGFVPYAVEPKALKLGERYIDEIWMALEL